MTSQVNSEQILQFIRSTIAAYITGHRADAIALLRAYGAKIDDNISDQLLTMATLKAMKDNTAFRGSLQAQLHGMVMNTVSPSENRIRIGGEASALQGGVARNGFSNYTGDAYNYADAVAQPTGTTPAATTNKSYLGQVFSADTVSNLLNTGLNILTGALNNKSAQAGTTAALQDEAARQDALRLAAAKQDQAKKATSVIVPIVIVLILGGAVFAYYRYKKKHPKK